MSRVNEILKSDVSDVIPYLQELYYNIIPKYARVGKMYLVGSRGRTTIDNWNKLKGKDWDIFVETDHLINNTTKEWGIKKGYYIEIICDKVEVINKLRQNDYYGSGKGIELFPNTPIEFKPYINE